MAKIDWKDGLQLETDVAIILQSQAEYGIYFDIGKAKYFLSLLENKKGDEYLKIRPYLDYDIIIKESKIKGETGYVKKPYLKSGEYTSSVTSHFSDPNIVDGPFSRIEIKEPSISKRQLIIKQLLKHGWEPTEFTEKGQPQLTNKGEPSESLLGVGDFGKSLANWYIYNHRQSQLRGFIENVRKDGRISSQFNGLTNTFRHKHKIVANVPRPTSLFGKEMRSVFSVPDNKDFVGADVSGLELRMLAHWMGDEEYIRILLEDDIHTYNQNKAGLGTRDQAKTFIYALLYGAGSTKIGGIVGGGSKQGKELIEDFYSSLSSLRKLVDKITKFVNKYGFIPSIDNRKIYIRSFMGKLLVHTALNAKLQADGSIVTKKAMVLANREIKNRKYKANQIIFYHDEFAYESDKLISENVGRVMVDSMRLSGEYYNLRLPIDGKYAIGKDWGVH